MEANHIETAASGQTQSPRLHKRLARFEALPPISGASAGKPADAAVGRAWAEINLGNLIHNLNEIRKLVKPTTMVMAVVKANAYGHGAARVSEALLRNGASRLAVASLDEAIHLRNSGISAPIQVLGHTFTGRVKEILEYDIIQTVFNTELAVALSKEANRRQVRARIHVKVDTGMKRVGFSTDSDGRDCIIRICKMPGIDVEGIMSHFAASDGNDTEFTYKQFREFKEMCDMLKDKGARIPVRHICNSAATVRFKEMHLEMVRPGVMLYGLYPSGHASVHQVSLKPVMTLKARVVFINHIEAGTSIGYGRDYIAGEDMIVATISIGYGDGYSRKLSNIGTVLINGEYARIIGNICMDLATVDVTGISKQVSIGDEVVLFGGKETDGIPVGSIAGKLGTIGYEVVCGISARVHRVYM